MKKIVVIMSLYKNDSLEYVKLAATSILSQTYKNFDFYIQYDGPVPDEVDAYLNSRKDERVKLREREVNQGLDCSFHEVRKIIMPAG